MASETSESVHMFHDIRFPTSISLGSIGGPERRTDIVVLGSGAEERNARWADSRRSYNAGYGISSIDDLNAVVAFFEERRGRLHAFRFRDPLDHKSCASAATPSAVDQALGIGDGTTAVFDLVKAYGASHDPYRRRITKPVAGSVVVAVSGVVMVPATFTVDHSKGTVTFIPGHVPMAGQLVTAGFMFDVPVRFDTDKLEINLSGFRSGAIPSIPLVEVRI